MKIDESGLRPANDDLTLDDLIGEDIYFRLKRKRQSYTFP